MRSLCCPLKQRLLERRKQGEWVRRLLQIHQEKVDGGWDGKPEEGHGGDEKWSRSGNTLNGSQQVCCWM